MSYDRNAVLAGLAHQASNAGSRIPIGATSVSFDELRYAIKNGKVDGIKPNETIASLIIDVQSTNGMTNTEETLIENVPTIEDVEIIILDRIIEKKIKKTEDLKECSYRNLFPKDKKAGFVGEFSDLTWGHLDEIFKSDYYADSKSLKKYTRALIDNSIHILNETKIVYANRLWESLRSYFKKHGMLPDENEIERLVNLDYDENDFLKYNDIEKAFDNPVNLLVGWHRLMYVNESVRQKYYAKKSYDIKEKFIRGALLPPVSLSDFIQRTNENMHIDECPDDAFEDDLMPELNLMA